MDLGLEHYGSEYHLVVVYLKQKEVENRENFEAALLEETILQKKSNIF